MGTKLHAVIAYFDDDEFGELKRDAGQQSLSNFIRSLRGRPPLRRGKHAGSGKGKTSGAQLVQTTTERQGEEVVKAQSSVTAEGTTSGVGGAEADGSGKLHSDNGYRELTIEPIYDNY